jgi:hypothetical protein
MSDLPEIIAFDPITFSLVSDEEPHHPSSNHICCSLAAHESQYCAA